MNFERALAQASDDLAKRRYRRGATARVKLGRGQKQALLRATLRAYAKRHLSSEHCLGDAPQLRLTRRSLHDWRCELGFPGLHESEASDSLYEWSRLFGQPQIVDIEEDGAILRLTLSMLHERDSETFDLRLNIDRDQTGRHEYESIVRFGLNVCDLGSLFDRAAPQYPAQRNVEPTDDIAAPLGDELQTVTRFLYSFSASVAHKFPERIRKARARIDADKREKKSPWLTAVAVFGILIAGWIAFTRIYKTSLAETDVDVRSGTWSRTFAFEANQDRIRTIDLRTKKPLSGWANAIIDPVTGDSIVFAGRQADGKYIYTLRVGRPPGGIQPTSRVCLPQWWYGDDNSPDPGFAIAPVKSQPAAESRRAVFMIVPDYRDRQLMDSVRNGTTIVEIGGRRRWSGAQYTLLDNQWPVLVFTSVLERSTLQQLTIYWKSATGKVIRAEYQLICPGDPSSVEFARMTDMHLMTVPQRHINWPVCGARTVFFAGWGAKWTPYPAEEAPAKLHHAYTNEPRLPNRYTPLTSFDTVPQVGYVFNDYGEIPEPGR
jgi:hypothetical protein